MTEKIISDTTSNTEKIKRLTNVLKSVNDFETKRKQKVINKNKFRKRSKR